MVGIDSQVGGGYTYQWGCAILLALNYFVQPVRLDPDLDDLVASFFDQVEKIQLEGESREEKIDLEDINLIGGDRHILIQVKMKEKEGQLLPLRDEALNKALYRFYRSNFLDAEADRVWFVFLTNCPFHEELGKIKKAIQAGKIRESDEVQKLLKRLSAYAKNNGKPVIDNDRYYRMLSQTLLVEYLSVEKVEGAIHLKLQAIGEQDWKTAHTRLFWEFSRLSTQKGGGIVTRSALMEVLESSLTIVGLGLAGARSLAVHFQAPPLPEHFIPRPEVVAMFKGRLQKIQASSGILPITGIHAIGGSGKTLTATYLAHEFQGDFKDGVLWAELGRDSDPQKRLDQLNGWVRELDPAAPRSGSEKDATDQLRGLVKDKSCLLVLDNVWEADHARPFLAGGSKCHVLITCRRKIETKDFVPLYIELPDMTIDQSLVLLEKRLSRQIEAGEREEAIALVEAIGFLPLALDLVAARVAKGSKSWADFYQPLMALESERRNKDNLLMITLNSSLVALREEDEQAWEAFIWLAVLMPGVQVSAPMCVTLWQVDLDAADNILEVLSNDALLVTSQVIVLEGKRWRSYRVHDLLYDLAVQLLTAPKQPQAEGEMPGLGYQETEAHAMLLDRYRAKTVSGEWHALSDDGYIYDHLAWHMKKTGTPEDLYALISNEWKDAKFVRYFNHRSFSEDINVAIQAANEEQNFPELARLCLLYATLGELATEVPPEALGVLARCGRAEVALGYAALLFDAGERCEAYRLIGEGLVAAGDTQRGKTALQQALTTVEKIGEVPKAQGLIKIAQTLAKSNYNEMAQGVSKLALSAAGEIEDENAKAKALSEVSQVLAQLGDQKGARDAAQQALAAAMKIKDEYSVTEALSSASQALARAGDQPGARIAARKAREEAKNIKIDFSKSEALVGVLQVLAQAGDWDEALKLVEEIGSGYYKSIALIGVVQALALDCDLARARDYARQAWDEVKNIQYEENKARVLTKLSHAMVQVDDLGGALAAAREALAAAIRSGKGFLKLEAVRVLAQTGNQDGLREAREAAEQMGNNEDNAKALSAVAQALAQAGDPVEALAVAQRTLVTAELSDRKTFKVDALIVVAQVLAQTDDKHGALIAAGRALGKVEKIVEPDIKDEYLSKVACVFAQAGNWTEALETANRIEDKNDSWKAPFRKALESIALVLIQIGDPIGALAVAEKNKDDYNLAKSWLSIAQMRAMADDPNGMRNAAIESLKAAKRDLIDLTEYGNEFYRVRTWKLVPLALALADDQLGALEVAEMSGDTYHNADAWIILARALAQADDRDGERVALAKSKNESEKPEVISRVVQGQADNPFGMLAKGQNVREYLNEAEALIDVSQVLSRAGDLDIAQDAARRALKATEKIVDKYDKAESLSKAALALAHAGDPMGARGAALLALATAAEIEEMDAKAKTLCNVVRALDHVSETGKAREASQLALAAAEKIEQNQFKAEALSGVAQALHASGDKMAMEVFRRALLTARFAKRQTVLLCLEGGAKLLADVDPEKTLHQVIEKIIEVDDWWGG